MNQLDPTRAADTTVYDKRGVYYFPGRVECPLAGVGNRPADHSNRLALDDSDTRVTIDREAARITVHNPHHYDDKKVVADLTFLADGTTESGEQSPFAIHLKIFKKGDTFSTDFHRHMRTQQRLREAVFEPFEVVATDGEQEGVMADEAACQKLSTSPSPALLIVKALMAMRDHLEGVEQKPTQPGFRLADLSLGVGPSFLPWMMVRAKLESLDDDCSDALALGSIAQMLRQGAWQLSLQVHTTFMMSDVIARDLFLFGLDEQPLLEGLRQGRLEKGQSLAFRFEGGDGEVGLDGEFEPMDAAMDVARAYLEYHMLGGLLVEHTERTCGLASSRADR